MRFSTSVWSMKAAAWATGSMLIHQMKNRDIRTIEQHELQELPQDAVEHRLPQEERLKNLLDKVGNPYCYLDNGIIVKLNFAPRGSSTLSERIGRCFQSAS